jgi:hypothetical protein
MLRPIAQKLDDWIAARNREARADGTRLIRRCRIRLLGQMALIEAGMPLTLAATNDVDVYADYEFSVEAEFRRMLKAQGKDLDPLGHEIWMPKETEYSALYSGRFVELFAADGDAILLSKALKAPAKNRLILVEYLARGASSRFIKLAKKYHLNLEQFV